MENINQIIELSKEKFLANLQKWIKIPSVKSEPQANAPFGDDVKQALETALEDAKNMGFEIRNFDNYVGDVRMGKIGEEPLAILAHLDVVPVGEGWSVDPFEGVITETKVVGRGTSDDKGPALAALYAMKAIKQAGIELNREVRLILGCDEESDWEDIAYYKSHCDMPKSGFSPDATYPVINTEKGLLAMDLTANYCEDGLIVKKIDVGQRHNVVPGKASAIIDMEKAQCDRINNLAKEMTLDVLAQPHEEGILLVANGILGHAAYPEIAKNAIGTLLLMLRALGVKGPLKKLADTIGVEYDGSSLEVACSDKTSGALTCNLGILKYSKEDGMYAVLDFRYPLLANAQNIINTVKATLTQEIEVKVTTHKQPHHVAPNSKLVSALLDAYHKETGRTRECISTGGGTYARSLEEGVAFGAQFPEEEDVAHHADEYVVIDTMMQNIKIIARAILNLATNIE